MNPVLRPKLKIFSFMIQTRNAQYNPNYVEPVFKPDDMDRLINENKVEDIAFKPIKAAKHDQHTSFFRDDMVAKFINVVMRKGKKELARNMVEKAFENIKYIQVEKYHKASPELRDSIECNPLTIFHQALENCTPLLKLTPVKRGAIIYQVPIPVGDSFARLMAMRWLIEASKDKVRTTHFPEKLAWELLEASKREGRAFKRKQELHKQCEANKAYAHYRWSS